MRAVLGFVQDFSRFNDALFIQRCVNDDKCSYIDPDTDHSTTVLGYIKELALLNLIWPAYLIYATYFNIFTAWRLYGAFNVEELLRMYAYSLQVVSD